MWAQEAAAIDHTKLPAPLAPRLPLAPEPGHHAHPSMLSDRGALLSARGSIAQFSSASSGHSWAKDASATPRSMSTLASARPSSLESGHRVWIDLGATEHSKLPHTVFIADDDPRAGELWEQERERERKLWEHQCVRAAGTRHRDLVVRSSQQTSARDEWEAVVGLTGVCVACAYAH